MTATAISPHIAKITRTAIIMPFQLRDDVLSPVNSFNKKREIQLNWQIQEYPLGT